MKVMIDTNIFISAALFPNGRASAALEKALAPPYRPLACDYIIDELHRKFREKFPDRMAELEAFLHAALPIIQVIPTPKDILEPENIIRDGFSGIFCKKSTHYKRSRFPQSLISTIIHKPISAASGRTAPAERCSPQRHLWPQP